ncbi:MAG: sulfite exporter TauE/SafE family protein, partial [Burkholderiales bacterium]
MEFWLLYLAVGAVAGFLAGLLGVGGGLIIVPVLTLVFSAQHFAPYPIVHLALGTSLASIVFSAIASTRAHHARGAVNWRILRRVTPGIIAGTLLGSILAAWLSSDSLTFFFALYIYATATHMLLDVQPKPQRQLPGPAGMFAVGAGIGGVSSLVGIGGASLSVPFLTWCNMELRHAIG